MEKKEGNEIDKSSEIWKWIIRISSEVVIDVQLNYIKGKFSTWKREERKLFEEFEN